VTIANKGAPFAVTRYSVVACLCPICSLVPDRPCPRFSLGVDSVPACLPECSTGPARASLLVLMVCLRVRECSCVCARLLARLCPTLVPDRFCPRQYVSPGSGGIVVQDCRDGVYYTVPQTLMTSCPFNATSCAAAAAYTQPAPLSVCPWAQGQLLCSDGATCCPPDSTCCPKPVNTLCCPIGIPCEFCQLNAACTICANTICNPAFVACLGDLFALFSLLASLLFAHSHTHT
jgi:hypothetical protein